ncbi:substrate-binding domain-containing protein [Aminobacter sp. MSH1]|uniref:substrate-binding domain-containing protein n=1 Tax=Aminobacter sp. MSH1 TaxID=374606 RepID=UPI00131F2BA7|nr:substrate-binding domain-containing protein [Aminobacter sp. MSH1]
MTVRNISNYKALGAALLGFVGFGALSAPSASAETADFCKAISGGVFCQELADKPPSWCGTKEVSFALADGTVNPWRTVTAAIALNELSQCPNVTSFEHTDGQNNTQKAISDLNSLTARGVNAIVLFPDAGPALLPAVRDAYKQGVSIVPYRASIGAGVEGQDYTAFVSTDFKESGKLWAEWMVKALNGKGKVVYLGGPAGTTQSREVGEGIAEVLKGYPDIEQVGEKPFEVTNWDSSVIAKTLTALISRYPNLDGVFADATYGVLTSGAFQRAGKAFPLMAGEDVNSFGCTWKKEHEKDPNSAFQYSSTSAGNWMVRLAVRWAVASAADGKVDEPFIIKGPDGTEHTVSEAGSKTIKNIQIDDSIAGRVTCNTNAPETTSPSTTLTDEQLNAALKGGI